MATGVYCSQQVKHKAFVLHLILCCAVINFINGDDRSSRNDSFQVFWNVPTFMCKPFNVDFTNVSAYGIIQNANDSFRGEKIIIFYDPGLFPSLTDNGQVDKNRGLPQLGDLEIHLQAIQKVIDKLIPDKNFQGLGIIDFESWRPIWKQNWGSLLPYREYSRNIEKRKHPTWSKERIEVEAERRFESAGRQFMEQTLALARQMRPGGKWGYYAFPYCFNYTPKHMQAECPAQTRTDNNKIQWLFDGSESLYPSLYLSKHKLNEEQRRRFVEGRLNEASRVARNAPRLSPPSMYPYIWYRYYDSQEYLSRNDIINSLTTAKRYRMGGAVLWGSSNDLNTKDKCEAFARFVREELGPIVLYLTDGKSDKMLSVGEENDEDENNQTTNHAFTIPYFSTILLP